MNGEYIIGIDPSGAYNEGKGTTGLAVLDSKTNKLAYTGWISAVNHPSLEAYFDAHIKWLEDCVKRYKDIIVSIEDYVLYAEHAAAHTNTHLETSQLLGLIKWWCYKNNITCTIRPAAAVKTRFNNNVLIKSGYIVDIQGRLYAKVRMNNHLSNHELDAIRHAAYCYKFELNNNKAVTPKVVDTAQLRRPAQDYEHLVIVFAEDDNEQARQVTPDPYYANIESMATVLRHYIKKHSLGIDCITRNGRIYLLKL